MIRVVEALTGHGRDAAAAVTARCVQEIPAYQRLPGPVLERDLVANVRAVIDLFLTAVVEDRGLTEAELAGPISWAAERVRDGLPLDAVLRIYPLAARELWRIATTSDEQQGEPGEPDALDRDLVPLVGRIFGLLADLLPRIAQAYHAEQQHEEWAQREGRYSLAAALLAGRPAQRAAERAGHRLAERYLVLTVDIPEPSQSTDTRAATSRFRRLQAALDTEPVLATFDRDGGVFLLPVAPDQQEPQQRAAAERVLRRIDSAAGARCRAGIALATSHATIPHAHRLATELLHLAGTLRRPPAGYWLTDLAIEYQVAQPGPARDCLAELLRPLNRHQHLLDALRALIDSNHQRAEAAAALHIHRNTLNYRLHRIRTLTGHDPTTPHGARILTAATIASALTEHPPADHHIPEQP
ncbi:PucR family transcriptional regulator [Amycolatopsis aidingensis]|uniref:PucR family transcriptional regulator n=1 Tax=Amycolatopsis aidingensis TaxID=2842453 RepID=UPI001C0CCD05|nr:helix-turn-helix domain-containing protein [Amycolatopsis aidingensis]